MGLFIVVLNYRIFILEEDLQHRIIVLMGLIIVSILSLHLLVRMQPYMLKLKIWSGLDLMMYGVNLKT